MGRKRRVFLDTSVLISASRGVDEVFQRAISFIDNPEVEFVSSIYVQLETLPKAVYNKRVDEEEFYRTFFDKVAVWPAPDSRLANFALKKALEYGLSAIDALHVAAAILCQADELVTTEKSSGPLGRVTDITVRFIALD
jgi:hypothetical protein